MSIVVSVDRCLCGSAHRDVELELLGERDGARRAVTYRGWCPDLGIAIVLKFVPTELEVAAEEAPGGIAPDYADSAE